jgi:hypothetical protein
MRTFLTFALIPCLLACQKRADDPPKSRTATAGLPALPAGSTAADPAAPAAPASRPQLTGTVLERIDAPPYSYLHLSLSGGGDDWAAVNQAEVKTGDKVTVANVTRMDGFESKTLKRRFDKLVFGNLVGGSPHGMAAQPAAAPAAAPADSNIGTAHTAVAAAADVHVEPAAGPGAATISEVYAKKAALKDSEVAVRGKIVKYTAGVMGKNWLHVQDGSGTQAKGDHDIAVTTTDEAKVGDVVTVRGPLHLDRDLGAGYAYSVIVEDAKLQR